MHESLGLSPGVSWQSDHQLVGFHYKSSERFWFIYPWVPGNQHRDIRQNNYSILRRSPIADSTECAYWACLLGLFTGRYY